MNWSYAKVIIIILLLLLNIGLGIIRIEEDRSKYTLSEEVEDNIRNILKIYDYQLYTFLPEEFYPVKNAKATQRPVDALTVAQRFFDKKTYNKSSEGNKDIYFSSEDTYVEVYRDGKIFYYEKFSPSDPYLQDKIIDKDEAYDLVTKFMLKIYKGDRIYKAASYDKEDNIFKYVYYNTLHDTYLFNDYIKINVYQDHIEAEVWGSNVSYNGDKPKDILPIDEIIFNFVKNVRNENLKEKYITDVQLGYYALNGDALVNGEQIEYPYYKITVKYDSDYYINAYTNEIYDSNLIKVTNENK